MLRIVSSRLRLCVAAGLLVLPGALPAQAQEGENFTISGEDGYGIVECMHAGSACGRVIADSWCESHGHAHAMAYGLGGDVTGSVSSAAAVTPVAAGDVVIRCGD